jgi:hypothetical protein
VISKAYLTQKSPSLELRRESPYLKNIWQVQNQQPETKEKNPSILIMLYNLTSNEQNRINRVNLYSFTQQSETMAT